MKISTFIHSPSLSTSIIRTWRI